MVAKQRKCRACMQARISTSPGSPWVQWSAARHCLPTLPKGIYLLAAGPWGDETLGAALLTPTRLYVMPLLDAVRIGGVHALAHITGGGLTENLPRVLPAGLGAEIDLESWSMPPVFSWLADQGGIESSEMLKTFNSGIGMVVVVEKDRAPDHIAAFQRAGETVSVLGTVTKGGGVSYIGALK